MQATTKEKAFQKCWPQITHRFKTLQPCHLETPKLPIHTTKNGSVPLPSLPISTPKKIRKKLRMLCPQRACCLLTPDGSQMRSRPVVEPWSFRRQSVATRRSVPKKGPFFGRSGQRNIGMKIQGLVMHMWYNINCISSVKGGLMIYFYDIYIYICVCVCVSVRLLTHGQKTSDEHVTSTWKKTANIVRGKVGCADYPRAPYQCAIWKKHLTQDFVHQPYQYHIQILLLLKPSSWNHITLPKTNMEP